MQMQMQEPESLASATKGQRQPEQGWKAWNYEENQEVIPATVVVYGSKAKYDIWVGGQKLLSEGYKSLKGTGWRGKLAGMAVNMGLGAEWPCWNLTKQKPR